MRPRSVTYDPNLAHLARRALPLLARRLRDHLEQTPFINLVTAMRASFYLVLSAAGRWVISNSHSRALGPRGRLLDLASEQDVKTDFS